MSPIPGWTEFSICCDRTYQDRLLVQGIGPFLQAGIQSSWIKRGFFLREEQNEQGHLRLRLATEAGEALQLQERLLLFLQQTALPEGGLSVTNNPSAHFDYHDILFAGSAALTLLEDFFCDSNQLVIAR